jgi:hypothetical protein
MKPLAALILLSLLGRRRGVYQELRDRKVALFIDNLPEGVWEIRANGVETRFIVEDGK